MTTTADPFTIATLAPGPSASPLAAVAVSIGYGDKVIVDTLDIAIPAGKLTVIVGPNACGKSTLLRALARLLKPATGAVLLDGRDIHALPTRQVAQRLGLLPQSPLAPEGILVADLVSRGRTPHHSLLHRWSTQDEAASIAAMTATGVLDLAQNRVDELSGGQRQRVWIAMALAQATELLLLDEPTTFLDLAHQVEVLDLLRHLNEVDGRTMVLVLHDLNLACRYADHVIAMRDGKIIDQGAPGEVMTAETVEAVFGLRCMIAPDPVAGTPMVVPLASTRTGR